MELLFRVAVFVPVLFLVAVVVVAQQHKTAQETIQAAVGRTVRWAIWSAARTRGETEPSERIRVPSMSKATIAMSRTWARYRSATTSNRMR